MRKKAKFNRSHTCFRCAGKTGRSNTTGKHCRNKMGKPFAAQP